MTENNWFRWWGTHRATTRHMSLTHRWQQCYETVRKTLGDDVQQWSPTAVTAVDHSCHCHFIGGVCCSLHKTRIFLERVVFGFFYKYCVISVKTAQYRSFFSLFLNNTPLIQASDGSIQHYLLQYCTNTANRSICWYQYQFDTFFSHPKIPQPVAEATVSLIPADRLGSSIGSNGLLFDLEIFNQSP